MNPITGKITRGIKPDTLLRQTMAFVEHSLPKWRDDTTREFVEAEEELNGQLCKFLNNRAREEFPMAYFHHEERQGERRRVDLSALPTSRAIEAEGYESIYRPILLIEGKRLPTPTAERTREYVSGLAEKSGGIQRFRLCLHGKAHVEALMVGYIQSGDGKHWRDLINKWIADFGDSNEDVTCVWTSADHLTDTSVNGEKGCWRSKSTHKRVNGHKDIRLIHLWVAMGSKRKAQKRKKAS